MAKITEDYCSFEVAKLLKEKGFGIKEETRGYYPIKGDATGRLMFGAEYHHNTSQVQIAAPTHQMAMKWLREVYKLSIEPYSIAIEENCIGYAYAICSCKTGLEIFAERWNGKNPFVSYEEAVEAALKYSLKI